MKTGIITTDTYLNHDTGQGHPERADRVTAVINHLKKIKLKNLIEIQAALKLTMDDIKTLIINSFKSSFLSEEKKKEWISKI